MILLKYTFLKVISYTGKNTVIETDCLNIFLIYFSKVIYILLFSLMGVSEWQSELTVWNGEHLSHW